MCLTALVLKESILLVTLVRVLSLTMTYMTKVSKRNIHQSFKGCRHTFETLIHTVRTYVCIDHLSKWHYVIKISAVKLYYVCSLSVLLISYTRIFIARCSF